MPMPPPITDVPAEKVGEVVQDFIDFDEVKELTVQQQPNSNFTVRPTG